MLQAVQFRGTAIQIAVVLTTTWAGAAARSQPAEGYPTAEQVRERLYAAAEARPDLCVAVDLTARYGTPPTHQGRHLYAVKVSANPGLEEDEPAVLFVAAHHGDEIASVLTALHGIDVLTEAYGTDADITRLLDTREVWIAPLWNPDGYESGRRLNGRRNDNGSIGVDLNRNYQSGWGTCGGSDTPGRATYSGPEPASEPETRTMVAWAADKRFVIVHDAHAGGFDIRTGYGCEVSHPWDAFFREQAGEIIQATGLEMRARNSCCLAGNIHHHMRTSLSSAFLWELGGKSGDSEAVREQAERVWRGVVGSFARPISLSGHTIDASTGEPVASTITILDAGFTLGETGASGGAFGRFDLVLPPGTHRIQFTAPGYSAWAISVMITPDSAETRQIRMVRDAQGAAAPVGDPQIVVKPPDGRSGSTLGPISGAAGRSDGE